jgi:pimeloyl-ACP methyl ester carboxylesterase
MNFRSVDSKERMLRRTKLAIVFSAVIVAAACTLAFVVAIRDDTLGRMDFRLWRAISSEAHGGRYVEVNGVKLYYEVFGHGLPAVVVLHGGLGSIVDMHNQIRTLAETRMVVAINSRGHGRSSDGPTPLSYGLMADDTLKLLDQLGLGPVDVVGWSDGGIIGLDLAMHHPERVRRLVAIGANFNPGGLISTPNAGGDPSSKEDSNRLYRKVTTMWRTEPNYSLEDLARIKVPTLIIAGERDAVRREHTDELANAIPGAREAIIAGSTHSVVIEKPETINSLILKFLNTESSVQK